MNNTGKSEPDDIGELNQTLVDEAKTQRSPILLLGLLAVLLVCLIIGIQAFGILYSIVFPPLPPLPQNITEIRHTPIDHGVDEWLYQTTQNACDVVRYYQEAGGVCSYPTADCINDASEEMRFSGSGEHVASCVGEAQFNIFAYRWEVNIADSYQSDLGSTKFTVMREVYWTGSVPPRLDPRQGFAFDN